MSDSLKHPMLLEPAGQCKEVGKGPVETGVQGLHSSSFEGENVHLESFDLLQAERQGQSQSES